jgi:hypothetical protein
MLARQGISWLLEYELKFVSGRNRRFGYLKSTRGQPLCVPNEVINLAVRSNCEQKSSHLSHETQGLGLYINLSATDTVYW